MLGSHMDVGVTETPSGILIIPLLSRWQGNLPHVLLSIIHILLPIYIAGALRELLQGELRAPGSHCSSTWGFGRECEMSPPLHLKLKYANGCTKEFQWVHSTLYILICEGEKSAAWWFLSSLISFRKCFYCETASIKGSSRSFDCIHRISSLLWLHVQT